MSDHEFKTQIRWRTTERVAFDPSDIPHIGAIVNLRHKEEPESSIETLAQSIATTGQIQAVVFRKANDGTPELVAGNRRRRAVELINSNPARFGLSEPIPLYGVFARLAEDEAFDYNLVENLEREGLGVVDRAFAARHLQDVCGWTQEKIGGRMRCSTSRVSQLVSLLSLPSEVLSRLAAETMTEADARKFQGLSRTKVDEALKRIDEGEKVGKVLREERESEGRTTRRTLKEVVEALVESGTDQGDALVAFIRGEAGIESVRLHDWEVALDENMIHEIEE